MGCEKTVSNIKKGLLIITSGVFRQNRGSVNLQACLKEEKRAAVNESSFIAAPYFLILILFSIVFSIDQ